MAEAAVDQPDNLAPLLASGDADALLAQMAGEQIDRMLSGLESDAPPPTENLKEAFEKLETETPAADPIPSAPLTTTTESKAAIESVPSSAESTHAEKTVASAANRPSLLVKLLEAINAPLAACPDWLRDALGKIAILTLLNAIGVLIFVKFFMHR